MVWVEGNFHWEVGKMKLKQTHFCRFGRNSTGERKGKVKTIQNRDLRNVNLLKTAK